MTINCKGNLIDLSTPKVMGIINATPDSFYPGSRLAEVESILKKTGDMLEAGADFIDIGGYSSRPGADDIPVEEEISRVIKPIKAILKTFPNCLISIDTFRSDVAEQAVEAGAAIVNDISGGQLDEKMIEKVAALKVPYIMMHMRGTPQKMNSLTNYKNLLGEITYYFSERLELARKHQIMDVIIDPGFGFSKTIDQNFELLKNLDYLKIFELPILVGVSRKSMIYKTLDVSSSEALNGTTALNTIALTKGAGILRVHDVNEAVECVKLFSKLNS